MNGIRRSGDAGIAWYLTNFEVSLLANLTTQLVALVDAPPPAGDDPFAAWEAEIDLEALDRTDDVVRRLFPSAYPDDPAADEEYLRYAEPGLRTLRDADARIVLDALAATDDGSAPVWIDQDATDAWLRTLNSLRLSLAMRLKITDAEQAERISNLTSKDPRAPLAEVYEWLGYALETLIAAL